MKQFVLALMAVAGALILSACQTVSLSKQWPPTFLDYPVAKEKFSEAKEVDLKSHPKAMMMRTRLKNGFKRPADLAQKYVVMQHGCGTQCLVSWIINKETGKVFEPISSDYGLAYRISSNLIVANPNPAPCKEEDQGFCDFYNRHYHETYYVLENDQLKQLTK